MKSNTIIMNEVDEVLSSFDDKYIIQGVVNKGKVIQDLDDYNEELVGAILNNETLKKQFVIKVNGISILKVNQLIEVFQLSDYWMDSYTKYTKKIGLTSKGKFLGEITDVVLDFPYKDTILKANMSKEEKEYEDMLPNEPFLNETVAKEEIDVLLDRKILVNAKKYDINGEHEVKEFSGEDNLIIKGNNLLGLHTIKQKYAGKVKLIFIDPPYNTGGDSFQYNDKFNHSTWLTFMKNRLEVAKELLSEDGSIFITLDTVELAHAKLLCDDVFGRSNFITTIQWKHSDNSNNNALVFSEDYNSILVYSKSPGWKPNFLNDADKRTHFKNPDNDPRGAWFDGNPVNNPGLRPNLQFDITTPNGKTIKHPPNGWRWSRETMKEKFATGELRFSEDETRVIRRTYLDEMKGLPPSNLWTNLKQTGHTRGAKYEQKKLFPSVPPTSLFSTPKPELLLKYIFEIASNENNLVLDFFMGSATTQAVALKMNRRFIGIEQMDYINSVSVPRLQKVIDGEQGGISKEVNWQGGSSFVYAELMEKNQGFLKTILNAKEIKTLKQTFNLMLNTGDFDFQVDLNEVSQTLWDLPFDEQKKILVKIIDKNQLYFNYSEIDDENVREFISESDYTFNKSFYEKRGK